MSALAGQAEFPRQWKILPCRFLTPDESLNIYRNNYYRNLQKSLSQTYEACTTLLGEDIFEKVSFGFIQKYPLKETNLAFYGEEFPRFLERSETISASWPFLSQLAELEKIIKELFLNGQNCGKMEIDFPVHQIWQSLLYDGDEIEDLNGKKILRVYRNDREQVFFELQERT